MKKIFNIFITMLFVLTLSSQVVKATDIYTPITSETALEAVEYVRTTFYADEFGDNRWTDKSKVLLLDPNIDDAIEIPSYGLTTVQFFVYNVGIAWPEEYPVEGTRTIPKQVLKDPNIPFYFLFNPGKVNTMNDLAIKGMLIHEFEHLYISKARYLYNRDKSAKVIAYPFTEKALELNIIGTKDILDPGQGVVICLFEHSKWAEYWAAIELPPLPEGATWLANLTSNDIRRFYSEDIIILQTFFPGIPLELLVEWGILDSWEYLTYMYLQSN